MRWINKNAVDLYKEKQTIAITISGNYDKEKGRFKLSGVGFYLKQIIPNLDDLIAKHLETNGYTVGIVAERIILIPTKHNLYEKGSNTHGTNLSIKALQEMMNQVPRTIKYPIYFIANGMGTFGGLSPKATKEAFSPLWDNQNVRMALWNPKMNKEIDRYCQRPK